MSDPTTPPIAPGARPPHDDPVAAELRGFGVVGILAALLVLAGNLLVVPLSALLVLVWAQRSGTSWRALGFVRPTSWTRTVVVGVVLGIAFKLLLKAIVMPLLGAPPVNARYHYLAHNPAALPFALYAVIIGAGFGEETVFRGFLFERLRALLGWSTGVRVAIVLLTALFFGAAHLADQGVPGAEQATIVGLVYGAIFARTGSLAMLMVAHASFDLAALALIYWDVEAPVAHAIFR